MNEPPYHPAHSPISPISQAAPNGARAGAKPGLRTESSSQPPLASTENLQTGVNIKATATIDDLARVFNTVLVASLTEEEQDFPGEFYKLMESPAFRAILASVQQLARSEGITVRQATERVIQTFRKMDELWRAYIYREGVERIGNGGA